MKNLSEKALLVSLSISQWTARKYDRKVTNEVNESHQAQDSGRFNKLLIAKAHLDTIQKTVSDLRAFHYENTLPWSDFGQRLLPSTNYFEYTRALGKLKDKFEETVDEFCKTYPSLITEAKVRLNTLFNETDYPANIRDMFEVKISYMPIPETEDLRLNLSEFEVDKLRADIGLEINDRFALAAQSVYTRITEQLRKMHERLSKSDNVFKNSLFENLQGLIELLPRLNVMGDPMIEALCDDMRNLLVSPDLVRQDDKLRQQKANEVDAILRNLNGFLNPSALKENPVEV